MAKTEYKYLTGYQKFVRDYYEKLCKNFKDDELKEKRKTAMKDISNMWKSLKQAGNLNEKYLKKPVPMTEEMKKCAKLKRDKKSGKKDKTEDEKDKKIKELESLLKELKVSTKK